MRRRRRWRWALDSSLPEMKAGSRRLRRSGGILVPRLSATLRSTPPERPSDDQGRSPGSRVDAGSARPSRRASASGRWVESSPLTVAGAASASALRASPNSLLAPGRDAWRTMIGCDHRSARTGVKRPEAAGRAPSASGCRRAGAASRHKGCGRGSSPRRNRSGSPATRRFRARQCWSRCRPGTRRE